MQGWLVCLGGRGEGEDRGGDDFAREGGEVCGDLDWERGGEVQGQDAWEGGIVVIWRMGGILWSILRWHSRWGLEEAGRG